jgi:hypothetical protein
VLNVALDAELNGSVQLRLLNGFLPSVADTFTVLDASTAIEGAFINVASGQRLATSDGLGSFLVHYGTGSAFDPSAVVLSEFQPSSPPGDYNGDGMVNAADYTQWRDTLGSTANLAADGNGNDVVDTGDYNVWKNNFGTAAEGGVAAAVPEPATSFLLSIGLSAAGILRRCRWRARLAQVRWLKGGYDIWRAHFGQSSGGVWVADANTAVPERPTRWLALAWIAILPQLRHTHPSAQAVSESSPFLKTRIGHTHGNSTTKSESRFRPSVIFRHAAQLALLDSTGPAVLDGRRVWFFEWHLARPDDRRCDRTRMEGNHVRSRWLPGLNRVKPHGAFDLFHPVDNSAHQATRTKERVTEDGAGNDSTVLKSCLLYPCDAIRSAIYV